MTQQTLLQRLKLGLSSQYYRLIGSMHAPFVKEWKNDPYHQIFGRFIELGRSFDAPARSVSKNVLNLGVAAIAKKTGDYRADLLRWDIDTADVSDSMYPK